MLVKQTKFRKTREATPSPVVSRVPDTKPSGRARVSSPVAAGFEVAALWGGPAVSSYCSRGVAHRGRGGSWSGACPQEGRSPALVFFSHPFWGFLPGSPAPCPPSCPWDTGLAASGEGKRVAGETEAGVCPPTLWGHQGGTPSSGFLRADCMPSVRHREHARLPLLTWEVRPSCPAGTGGYPPWSG